VAFRHRASQRIGTAILAYLAAFAHCARPRRRRSATVLNDPANLPTVIQRSYELAFTTLTRVMPPATAAALAPAAYGIRRRSTIAPFPVRRAALAGPLAGSVAGALVSDSGPLLLCSASPC